MKRAGQIALMPFPYTNLANNKKRPVLKNDHGQAQHSLT